MPAKATDQGQRAPIQTVSVERQGGVRHWFDDAKRHRPSPARDTHSPARSRVASRSRSPELLVRHEPPDRRRVNRRLAPLVDAARLRCSDPFRLPLTSQVRLERAALNGVDAVAATCRARRGARGRAISHHHGARAASTDRAGRPHPSRMMPTSPAAALDPPLPMRRVGTLSRMGPMRNKVSAPRGRFARK